MLVLGLLFVAADARDTIDLLEGELSQFLCVFIAILSLVNAVKLTTR